MCVCNTIQLLMNNTKQFFIEYYYEKSLHELDKLLLINAIY